ncbi:MAG: hypothetical protein GAK28_02386 [Luteibacter sp.]|uniref:TetR/AcrR family transcriptional regulator n=1 Tax=Luteibacter sp. TaxID=1886636 RepID=UPI00137D70FF|nr:TetR/AcrR family transcriptional regulator [Luteibacter sp.]KAF1006712.1 MAG: hypothetical protein GAK28_02386 [Luteibacter sp.]
MSDSCPSSRYHHGDLPGALRRAAWDMVGEAGVRGLSLRECARRAGVSHAAPAHHFGSLEGLLIEVAADGYERMAVIMDEEIERAGDRLPGCGLGYIRFATTHPQQFRLMLGTDRGAGESPRLREAASAALGRLREAIRDAWIARHGQSPDDVFLEERTALAWSAAHGYALLSIDRQLLTTSLPSAWRVLSPLIETLLRP